MITVTGYTTGVFDLFHIGHLNLLRAARSLCDRLIVGVTTDELTQKDKGRMPVIPFEERIQIVRAIKYVDIAVAQSGSRDKYEAWLKLQFDIVFVADDHYKEDCWIEWESRLLVHKVKVIYLPYTQGVSSTRLVGQVKQLG